MADIKWSAFPDGGEILGSDKMVGLRAGANVQLDANIFSDDITVNSLKMGRGAAEISSNIGIGGLTNASTTGNESVAIGTQAMTGVFTGTGAVAVGENACQAASSGDYHTGVGFKSLSFIEGGDRNTAFGAHSGGAAGGALAVVTGDDNTLIGYGAGGNSAALTGAIAIGSLAKAEVSTGATDSDNGPGLAIGSSVVPVGFRGDGTVYPAAGVSAGYVRIKLNGVNYKMLLLADV
jgi:hypothetical protein